MYLNSPVEALKGIVVVPVKVIVPVPSVPSDETLNILILNPATDVVSTISVKPTLLVKVHVKVSGYFNIITPEPPA